MRFEQVVVVVVAAAAATVLVHLKLFCWEAHPTTRRAEKLRIPEI